MTSARRHIRRLAGESGFTMIVTLGVMLVSSLLMATAFVAATGDIHLTHTDTSAKKAYYAALAGISNYVYHLNQDVNYWTYCTGGAAAENHSLNLYPATTNRVAVPEDPEESYAIDLLPASTAGVEEKCNPANPVKSMVETGASANGTFHIESTGYSGNQERTVVATFTHTSFLNFIYYTKYETLDPVTYTPPEPKCAAFNGSRPEPPCQLIDFITADHINGPMHTEDKVETCGEPTFGREAKDEIEFRLGWNARCGGSPKFLGTYKAKVESIEPPPSDVTLKQQVEAPYHYTGKTTIVLQGAHMEVTNNKGVTTKNVPLPENGLIYVSNETCGVTYTPFGPTYTADTGCGNVYVSGNYSGQLTIAAENDVVINGNITTAVNAEGVPTTNAVLGLIANNFVRVYHPLNKARPNEFGACNGAENSPESIKNYTIYAAILAVNHSFIVDNFDCGAPEGTLFVYGAIAQIFRGTVGTHSGEAISSGYAKNYNYDNRLRVESPPHFLSPVEAAWVVRRETLAEKP